MKLRRFSIAILALLSTACAGTMQYASISEAYKSYERGKFEKTLLLTSQAENARPMSRDQKAEMSYLKAQALEGLGRASQAAALYDYIEEQHASSPYAYLVRQRRKDPP